MDALPYQVVIFDSQARFVYVSPSAIADDDVRAWAIGRTNEEYCLERLAAPEMGRRRDHAIRRVFETGDAIDLKETLINRQGAQRYFVRRLAPIKRETGEVAFVFGHGGDETDAVTTRHALHETAARAQELARAKGRFLGSISHEVRTPVSAIVAALHLLSEAKLNGAERSLVLQAQDSARVLLNLLNGVFDMSRIGSGQVTLQMDAFSPGRVVSEVVAASAPSARLKGIELSCEIAPDVPAEVIGDRLRLRQIVSNLVSNSLRYTDRGRVWVSLSARFDPRSHGECRVEIRVEDTGRGIDAHDLPYVFDKFVQAGSPDDDVMPSGTGLGLAIVRELVELQHGSVGVTSALGRGTEFNVTLPYRLGASRSERGAEPAPAQALAGCHVTIAEDNAVIQALVQTILEKAGAEVTAFPDGGSLLEWIRESPKADIVLMDIQMPGIDGVEATRQIRDVLHYSNLTLPVIALTAAAQSESREAILAAGANEFIVKPFDPLELVSRIRSVWLTSQALRTPHPATQ